MIHEIHIYIFLDAALHIWNIIIILQWGSIEVNFLHITTHE